MGFISVLIRARRVKRRRAYYGRSVSAGCLGCAESRGKPYLTGDRALRCRDVGSEAEILPQRRRTRPGGRHRGSQSLEVPPDSPIFVLGVPGPVTADESAAARTGREIVSLLGTAHGARDVRVAYLGDEESRQGDLEEVLARLPENPAGTAAGDAEGSSLGGPEFPRAVVIPLVAGPDPRLETAGRLAGATGVPMAEALGPHPLLAEVLHVRLAEAGLARADRIRLVGITTAADGIILGAVGGETAARVADATAVLLAARLAVPAIPAALDGSPTVAAAAERLKGIGASRIALAPYLIGPEIGADRLAESAAEVGAEAAAPLGVHPALAQLVVERYLDALEAWARGEAAAAAPPPGADPGH